MSGHSGCSRRKMKNSWWNHNGHNVQIWLSTGHSSFFFSPLKTSCMESWLVQANDSRCTGVSGTILRPNRERMCSVDFPPWSAAPNCKFCLGPRAIARLSFQGLHQPLFWDHRVNNNNNTKGAFCQASARRHTTAPSTLIHTPQPLITICVPSWPPQRLGVSLSACLKRASHRALYIPANATLLYI